MRNYCSDGATVHGIRHAFRDRLRAVEAPVDLIDQLGGWSSKSIGLGYGDGYDMRSAHYHLSHICFDMTPNMKTVPQSADGTGSIVIVEESVAILDNVFDG